MKSSAKPNAPTVSCPICGKHALFGPENKFRPFCSERCKLIDLGQWATESYRIPLAEDAETKNGEDGLN
ncbi:MAG: DNA gyrase inhibitor YacG [Sulfuricella sp.]|nr:DNA gyrase inhibitor YacG [Sulfuricella sp.]